MIPSPVTKTNAHSTQTPASADASAKRIAALLSGLFPQPAGAHAQQPEAPRRMRYPQNDFGRAARFVKEQRDHARFVRELNCWIVWDGLHWIRDFPGVAILNRSIIHLNSSIQDAQEAGAKDDFDEAIRTGEYRNISRMLQLAKANFRMIVPIDCLDRRPHLLNVRNGILDLNTGELEPHDPGYFCTRLADIEYNPEATCPRWQRFVQEITSGDAALARYLQKLAGYILTGETTEQAFFYLHGIGANGKSTFLTTLANLLGSYAEVVPYSLVSLISREPLLHAARTFGARLLILPEVPEQLALSEARLKVLTGSDLVTGCFQGATPFTFIPSGKVCLQSNHLPQIHGKDEAIWRRLHLVPFQNRFAGTERDNHLLETLSAELPGILNWALEGTQLWKTEGLQIPPAVQQAVEICRGEQDPVHQFLAEETEAAPDAKIELSELYDRYCEWATAAGESQPLLRKPFSKALVAHGLTQTRTKTARFWNGIRLRPANPSTHQAAA